MQTHPWRGSSISQITTYEASPRKWWFQKILKLPERTKDVFAYGNVLHAAIERYLRGAPLEECFPPGWQTDGGTTLDFQQSTAIQAMVRKAVEQGVVVRLPNAIEPEFQFKLALHPKLPLVFGYVDYGSFDGQIIDHKSVASRRYAKNARDLMVDRQLRFYAEAVGRSVEPSKRPSEWRGYHNNFCKYDQEVWQTEPAIYTAPMIRENLTECTEVMFRMAGDAGKRDWKDIQCPATCADKYGGCPFKDVCSQSITVEQYVRSILEPGTMGAFDNLKTLKAPAATKPPPVIVQTVEVKTAPAAPPVAAVTAGGPAPWADPGCIACKGSGWASKGPVPCRVCVARIVQNGKPHPNNFEIVVSEGGVPTAVPLSDPVNGSTPSNTAPPQPVVAATAPPESVEPAVAAAPAAPQAPAKRGPGRPKKVQAAPAPQPTPVAELPVLHAGGVTRSFVLVVDGIATVRGNGVFATAPVLELSDLIFDGPLGAVIAAEFHVNQYAAAPALKRGDLLVAIGAEWIKQNCTGSVIFCSTGIPEFRPLIERLAPAADLVFRAIN